MDEAGTRRIPFMREGASSLLAEFLGIAILATVGSVGIAGSALAGPAADADSDGVFDVLDNCSTLANAPPLDCDTDDDGYGNACDGDFDQTHIVNAADFSTYFLPDFITGTDGGTGTDMNCAGTTASTDFSTHFVPQFKAGKPGPSGLHCAGTVPCDL